MPPSPEPASTAHAESLPETSSESPPETLSVTLRYFAAAADAVLFINKIIKKIQFIYGIINFIVDFIQNLAYKKAQMIEVQNTMSNLAEAATRRAAATA